MKALILAAGQGTRLKYLTFRRPKPMLPIGNIPLLQHTIEWLRDYGVNEIAINLFHHADAITNYFGNGDHFGVSILYSHESDLLGTAGAAKKLVHFLDESFIIVYGDVYTNLDLKRICRSHLRHINEERSCSDSAAVTMALYEVVNPEECGLVETDAIGRVTRFVEKPRRDQIFTNQAFSGVMICCPKLLDYVPEGVSYDFGSQLLPELLKSEIPLYGEPITQNEFVIDIGTLPGYLRALQTAAAEKVNYQF